MTGPGLAWRHGELSFGGLDAAGQGRLTAFLLGTRSRPSAFIQVRLPCSSQLGRMKVANRLGEAIDVPSNDDAYVLRPATDAAG